MEDILRINVAFIWNKECIEAFETLKNLLIKTPILRFINWSKKFHVHIDASAIVDGEILTQHGDDSMDHPKGYAIQKFNKTERKYSMTGREGLGMVFSL